MHYNKYDVSILNKFNNTKNKQKQSTLNTKWAKFTYTGNETKFITKLFNNTTIKIVFTTSNSIERLLSTQHSCNQNKFEKCGIYQLTFPTCNKRSIGQTGWPFHIRFQEHFRDYKYGNNKSKFAQHLLENRHSIGPIENIMDIAHTAIKGRMLDTLENSTSIEKPNVTIKLTINWMLNPM
jgi:hypothetical protein